MTQDARQLELFTRSPEDDLVFTEVAVDRAGMAKYIHLIRYGSDPQRSCRGKPRTFDWRRLNDRPPEEWAKRIAAHLGDGKPRTFNRLMAELADVTADVAFDSHADSGLWLAVDRRLIVHTLAAPVFFRIARGGAAPEAP